MKWLSGVLAVYAVANLVMGLSAVTKSPISLVAGGAVALLAGFGAWYGLKKPSVGYIFGVIAALLPLGQFVPKIIKEPVLPVYPALVGTILSVLTLACLMVGHFQYHKPPAQTH